MITLGRWASLNDVQADNQKIHGETISLAPSLRAFAEIAETAQDALTDRDIGRRPLSCNSLRPTSVRLSISVRIIALRAPLRRFERRAVRSGIPKDANKAKRLQIFLTRKSHANLA
ncbi:hypothetical protein CCP2SC5_190033 [Azospirillaceae bacterium]